MQQTSIGDSGKVGIWGAISGFGATNVKTYRKNMNGKLYCDVLQNEVKQFSAKTPVQGKVVFQQDLIPWHT